MGHKFEIVHGFLFENFQDLHQYDNEILQIVAMHPIKAHVTSEVAREGGGSIMDEIYTCLHKVPPMGIFCIIHHEILAYCA